MVRFVRYELDPAKNAVNTAKHGIPLPVGGHVVSDPKCLTFVDDRFDYAVTRLINIGRFRDRAFVAVYTMRADIYRFISVRKANAREQARYRPG